MSPLTDSLDRTYPGAEVIVTEPGTYVDRSLPTASWWDKYTIEPGTYPIEYVNIDYRPWNPDPDVCTPGFIANTGPYYAIARVKARRIESYRENRLLHLTQAEHTQHDTEATVTVCLYAYEIERARGTVRTVLDRTGVIHLTD